MEASAQEAQRGTEDVGPPAQPSPGMWLLLALPSLSLHWMLTMAQAKSPKLIQQHSSSPVLHLPTPPVPSQGHTEIHVGGRRAQGPLGDGLSEGMLVQIDWERDGGCKKWEICYHRGAGLMGAL